MISCGVKFCLIVHDQSERNVRSGQGHPLQQDGNITGFRLGCLQKLLSRRGIVKEISHQKSGSFRCANLLNRFLLSADYVAAFRDHIEAQTNAYAAFFLGASGDVNPLSKIPNHTRTTHYDAYGRLLAQTVLNALDRLKPIPSGPVNTQRIRFTADIDHTEDPLLEQARQIAALWTRTNDYALCVQTGRPHGIASPFHALSIIRRAQNPNTVQQMDIVAGSMGDVGFVAAPFEMFTANGLSIKARSPFSATFVLTCANGSYHYIASDQAFDYGSYEVHNRNYSRGTAEALANSMVDLLTRLHNTK